MKIFTPRSLVGRMLRAQSLTQLRIDRAVKRLALDDWVLAYRPVVCEPHRPVVAVRSPEPVADLLRRTFQASIEEADAMAWLRVSELDTAVGHRFPEAESLEALARRGLAVVRFQDGQAGLIGTSPLLAKIVNRLRLGREARGGWSSHRVVQAALGLPQRPLRLTDQRLLAAAEVLDRFQIEASDLLGRGKRTHLQPRWIIATHRLRVA